MAERSLGWAIAGTGRIARRFAADMRFARSGRIVAVASRDARRAQDLAAAIGPDLRHGALDDILRLPGVGAVYLAGRNEDHCEQAIRCLAAGKPVLVEKPFATSAKEARQIAYAAARARLLATEAMWMRFTPGIRRLKALTDAGAVGALRSLEASLAFRSPQPATSPLLDLGVYPISLALHLLGAPTDISAGESADGMQASLILRYPNAIATLACGLDVEGANGAAVVGETGVLSVAAPFFCPPMLTLRRTSAAAQAIDAPNVSKSSRPRLGWIGSAKAVLRPLRARRYPMFVQGSGLHYQADHFADCLAAGLAQSPIMPLADSIETIRIVEAADALLSGSRGVRARQGFEG